MPFSFYLMRLCISIMISAFAGIIMYIVVTRTNTRPLLCFCKRMLSHIPLFTTHRTAFPVISFIILCSPYVCMAYCISSKYCCWVLPPPKIRTIRLNISPTAVNRLLIFISGTSFYIFFASFSISMIFLSYKKLDRISPVWF